jgi:hypothetical protein
MAKKRRSGSSYFPIKIPINTLSGGVGRQAPTKRLPSEVESMNNILCTTERSVDKRNGFTPLEGYGLNMDIGSGQKIWWQWFLVGKKQQYIIGVDFSAGNGDQLLYVYKIEPDGSVSKQNIDPAFVDMLPSDSEYTDDIANIRAYITYGSSAAAKDVLRSVSVGSSLLVLNTEVKAGFSSDGTDDKMFDLNGDKTTDTDTLGRRIEYQTSITVDPEGTGEYWVSGTDYIWKQRVIDGNVDMEGDASRHRIYSVKGGLAAGNLPGPTNAVYNSRPGASGGSTYYNEVGDSDNNFSKYIPVEDYIYPDGTELHFGQSISKWSDLKFPPDANDLTAHNGDVDTKATIQSLYPDSGDSSGSGKIYYLNQAYLSSTPGWYRVINSENTPYLEKVRTPDEMGIIDQNRMPMQIYLDEVNNHWSIRKIDWDPRTSGTTNSNPGPSFFKDKDKKAKQVKIKAMSYYRDRLFLASEDTLVSSRLGNFDNFYLDDPANITFRDPVDLKVSSNVYTPITFLQPFKDFLFLGTSGDTQYELMGSENQISPLTAEIAPTSFFPMTEDMSPLVMNNSLYFFAKNRLFIYFPSFEATGQQAFELSTHAPEYLPDNYWTSTVSTAHNTIFAVAGESPGSEIFCYRNQTAGEKVVQNAFFTFTTNFSVHSMAAIGDYLYAITEQPDAMGTPITQLQKMSLLPDIGNEPRLDNKVGVLPANIQYDSSTNKTLFDVPISLSNLTQFVCQAGQLSGSIIDVTVVQGGSSSTSTRLSADGNYTNIGYGIAGTKYTAEITLSDIFVRDEVNNIIPGTLNIRYGILRHHKTGPYSVSIQRKNRTPNVYTFTHEVVDSTESVTGDDFFELDGTFKFPLMGFSDDLVIKISSDYPNPMNITNIEFSGKFKRVHHFLTK